MGYMYIFKGTYEKKFQTGEDMAEDEIEKHRKGRVVSSFDAIWRELGFPMFVCEPQVKDATLHELKVLAEESRTRDGASHFAKYVFRPIEVDRFLERTDDNPVTMTEFHEMFEAVLRPPASVTRYMRQHGLATAEAIPTAAWSNMKTADGRNIFFLPCHGLVLQRCSITAGSMTACFALRGRGLARKGGIAVLWLASLVSNHKSMHAWATPPEPLRVCAPFMGLFLNPMKPRLGPAISYGKRMRPSTQ